MGKNKTMVLGVGTNDADYSVHNFKYVDGKLKITWRCPFYNKWCAVLERCFSKRYKEKYSSYQDCTIDERWLRFSNFKSWMEGQKWDGMCIDKDILIPGNKLYGPDTCCFVTAKLNKFVMSGRKRDSNLLMGASWHGKSKSYAASCGNPFTGKSEHLGCFKTEIEAHQAWKNRKHELACQFAEYQTDQRVAEALRTRYL